ncbi:MAG: hypothetical protein K2F91_09850 [Muribaculaceae bacterium]|nr:hypothetical protein [Muribaculaceae bacterium]
MKLKNFALGIIAAASVAGLSSCNSNDNPLPPTVIYTDIVTIAAMNADGSAFTFQKENDSPLVTLTTKQTLSPDHFKVNTRAVISYTSESDHATSGPVNLLAAAETYGRGDAPATVSAEQAGNWETSPVDNIIVQRSGQYVNVVFTAYTDSTPKLCRVVLDEATLNDEYPTLYLLFEPQEFGINPGNYAIYMSYSLAGIFAQSTSKGVEVVYKDNTNTTKSVQLDKMSSGLTPSN